MTNEKIDEEVAEKVTKIAARLPDGRLIWNPDVPSKYTWPPKYSTNAEHDVEVLNYVRDNWNDVQKEGFLRALESDWEKMTPLDYKVGDYSRAALSCLAAAGEEEQG